MHTISPKNITYIEPLDISQDSHLINTNGNDNNTNIVPRNKKKDCLVKPEKSYINLVLTFLLT